MTKPLNAPSKVGALDTLAAGTPGTRPALPPRLGEEDRRERGDSLTRFAYILKEIRTCLEVEILRRIEERLKRLEEPHTLRPSDQRPEARLQ